MLDGTNRMNILAKAGRIAAFPPVFIAVLIGCSTVESEKIVKPTVPHAIILNWKPSPGATSYNIYRASRPGGPYRKLGASKDPRFLDFPISAQSTLYYTVTAINAYGESAPSARLTASVP
jgi:hypothetical protein